MTLRPISLATLVVAAVVAIAWPCAVHAQEVSLAAVLARAGAYVMEFQRHLSGIVAEETYVQDYRRSKTVVTREDFVPHRELRSDFLLVRPAGAERFIEFRDVFEVDGKPVRDRQDRLTKLFLDTSASSSNQVGAIISESARYNIGNIQRTLNTPTLPLMFLSPAYQWRFRFKRSTNVTPTITVGTGRASEAASGHFTVSTEVWVVEYREVEPSTVIRTTNLRDLPSRGRFWIEPMTGKVLMSELVAEDTLVRGIIDVSYQSEPLMGVLVPVEMRERYEGRRDGGVIRGTATYGRFRQFQVSVNEDIGPVKD